MKFDCGPTRKEREKVKERWHKWFAWCPVRLGERECVWLETVERKGIIQYTTSASWWSWEYRPCA